MNREQLIGLILATTLTVTPLKVGALENQKVDMLKSQIGLSLASNVSSDIKASSKSVFESITGSDKNKNCEQNYFYCSDFGGHAFIDQTIKLAREKAEKEEAERKRIEEEQRKERERQEKERARINSVSYNYSDVRIPSNVTHEEFKEVLSNKVGGSMAHLASAFVDAERIHGVNAFFLAGLAALEGDWARSPRARNQNNLTGMAVNTDSSPGTSYSSQYECILDTARQISKNYLRSEGSYYGGGYGVQHVNYYYSASDTWNDKVNSIAGDLYNVYTRLYK